MNFSMNTSRLVRFMIPLAITSIVLELGSQVLNGGMARIPQATMTLAAYGLGWGIILFMAAPLAQTKELGLVMVNDPASFRAVRRFVVLAGIVLMVGLASLTLTPLGTLAIEELHGIDSSLGKVVRVALFWLIPYPLLRGFSVFHTGLLLRVRRTALVSYATLSNLGISILAVFILVNVPWIQAQPIRLPIVVTYIGQLVELGIVLWGVTRYALPHLARLATLQSEAKGRMASAPSAGEIVRFFWPLALIMIIQEFSRPMINLFVARGPNPTATLAILAVLYTLGRMPYGWLNEIRNLHPVFHEEANSRAYIRRFAVGCGVVSLAFMAIFFWTPLRDVMLLDWIGVPPHLAALAPMPLRLFAIFSLTVTARAYYHGIALVERRTHTLAPSAPARLLAIILTSLLLPLIGITGATLGVAALAAGFATEALVVWWGVRGRDRWRSRATTTPAKANKMRPTPKSLP